VSKAELADIVRLEAAWGFPWPDDIMFPYEIFYLQYDVVEVYWRVRDGKFGTPMILMMTLHASPSSGACIFDNDRGAWITHTKDSVFDYVRRRYPELTKAKR
jgi:hypothetical protein